MKEPNKKQFLKCEATRSSRRQIGKEKYKKRERNVRIRQTTTQKER